MNETVKTVFSTLRQGQICYENAVLAALLAFRRQKEKITAEASAYKDEDAYCRQHLDPAKEEALSAVRKAEIAFRNDLKNSSMHLHKELETALAEPIDAAFAAKIAFYRASGLTPSKTESEILLKQAGKHPAAVAAVAQMLDDAASKWRVTGRSVADFEDDLAALDRLVDQPSLLYAPHEAHAELCDILRGKPNGKPGARTWGDDIGGVSVELLTNRAAIVTALKRLEDAAPAWTGGVSYGLREAENRDEIESRRQKAEAHGETFIAPEEPQNSTIEDVPARESALELAKEIGAEKTPRPIPERYLR